MRYVLLFAALAMLMPACAGDTEGDSSTTPPKETPKPNTTPEDPGGTPVVDPGGTPDVDPGPEVAMQTIVLDVEGMT